MRPAGTPLASAIKQTAWGFAPSEKPGAQVIYIVSDGEETCGGDPVAAARSLHNGETQAIINIIGFDLQPNDRDQLRAVASAGGGEFIEVSDPNTLSRRMSEAWRGINNNSAFANAQLENNRTIGRNNTDWSRSINQRRTCLSKGIQQDVRSLNNWFDNDGEAPLTMRSDAFRLMTARHDIYQGRADRYDELLTARRNRANEGLSSATREERRELDNVD